MVNFATSAEIAPTAAKTGATIMPIAAKVTGISMNVLPCSSLMIDSLNVSLVNQRPYLVYQVPHGHLHFFH